MDQRTRDNWEKIRLGLEAAGKTDCHLYRRAIAIHHGTIDPGPFAPLPPSPPNHAT